MSFLLVACAASAEPRADEAPLVIELFTSQGCSSCPPADQLLSKLAREGALGDRKLAPLSFHVDYWNDLGWTDPFSLAAWTDRQRGYARALREDSVYTPELVVGGGAVVVGSQTAAVARAIAAAPRQIAVTASASWEPARVTIEATAPADANVWVAIWEDSTRTEVERGENSGKTLVGDRVVRRLEHVASAGHTRKVTIPLDPAWKVGGAVAFAQRDDRRIVGATVLRR